MITNTWKYKGTKVRFTFFDGHNVSKFEPYAQSYAICFRNDGKIIIGLHPGEYGNWLLPGGRREHGESGIQTLKRELDEELSLKLKKYHLIGAQRVDFLNKKRKSYYQLRYAAIVKVNKLTPDPDNGLMWKRKAINPKEFSKYLPWGNIGEHLLKEAVKWYDKERHISKN